MSEETSEEAVYFIWQDRFQRRSNREIGNRKTGPASLGKQRRG